MTKREIKRLYKASRVGHGKYWGNLRYKAIDGKNIWHSSAMLDRFTGLMHNRLSANSKMLVNANMVSLRDKYDKAKEYALAGPKGKLP